MDDLYYDSRGFLFLKIVHRDAWLIIPDLTELLVDPENRLISGGHILAVPGQAFDEEELYQTIATNFMMPVN